MTTTEKTVTVGQHDGPRCLNCGQPANHIEGTDVYNCNACGWTGGSAKSDPQPEADVPRETVQPDEVLAAGKHVPRSEDPERTQLDHNEQLERLTEVALESPGVPGRDEFLTLAQTARMLAMSPLVPKFLRGNPAACFHLAMIGRDLGISPTSAVELIDIMPDDRNPSTTTGRPMLSPELLNGQIIRMGLGSIAPLVKREDLCIAVALAPGGALDRKCCKIGRHFYGTPDDYKDMGFPEGTEHPDFGQCSCHGIIGERVFDWAEAQTAELIGPLCQPGDHKKVTKQRRNGSGSYTACDCNQGYITYPKQMMWWRASGFCQTENFPQASIGLYTAEAMGALVDGTGRMLDPATVELPEGFEPPAPVPTAASADRVPASAAEIANVGGRIADLPPEQQTSLKQLWTAKQAERRVESVAKLTKPGLRVALALLDTAEREARAKGWEPTFVPVAESVDPGTPEPGPVTEPLPEPQPTGEGPPEPAVPFHASAPLDQQPTATAPDSPPTGDTTPESSEGKVTPMDAATRTAAATKGGPAITVAHMDAAIAIVKSMNGRQLNDALRSRSLKVDGTADDRGARLAQAFAREAAQQDWEAATAKESE